VCFFQATASNRKSCFKLEADRDFKRRPHSPRIIKGPGQPVLVRTDRSARAAGFRRFLAKWGEQAEALGWTARDLFGLHEPLAQPQRRSARKNHRLPRGGLRHAHLVPARFGTQNAVGPSQKPSQLGGFPPHNWQTDVEEAEFESLTANIEIIAAQNRTAIFLHMVLTPCLASNFQFNRDSPDESQTGINIRVFPALLQDRHEVLTATSTSGSRTLGRGSDLAIFPGIWTHSFCRLPECMTSNLSR
jgi:hypothetical protein